MNIYYFLPNSHIQIYSPDGTLSRQDESFVNQKVLLFQKHLDYLERLNNLAALQEWGYLPTGFLVIINDQVDITSLLDQLGLLSRSPLEQAALIEIDAPILTTNPNMINYFNSVATHLKIPDTTHQTNNYTIIPMTAAKINTFLELVYQYSSNISRLN
ncbi:MAG: hypothetical protein QXR96_01925 [Candidatus Woesearchaeota archaeon]